MSMFLQEMVLQMMREVDGMFNLNSSLSRDLRTAGRLSIGKARAVRKHQQPVVLAITSGSTSSMPLAKTSGRVVPTVQISSGRDSRIAAHVKNGGKTYTCNKFVESNWLYFAQATLYRERTQHSGTVVHFGGRRGDQ